MLTIFLWLVLIVNGTLAMIWSKDAGRDVVIKLSLAAISLMAIVLLLEQYGFVVKV